MLEILPDADSTERCSVCLEGPRLCARINVDPGERPEWEFRICVPCLGQLARTTGGDVVEHVTRREGE